MSSATTKDPSSRCTRCNAKNSASAQFCGTCGAPLMPNASQPIWSPPVNDFLLPEGEFLIDEQGVERCEIIRAPGQSSPCREYQARSLGTQDGLCLRLFEAATRQPLGAVIDLATTLGQGVQLPHVSRLLQPFASRWPAHGDARRTYVAEVAPANELKSGAIDRLKEADWQLWLRQLALGLDALHKKEVAFGFKVEDVLLHVCVTEDGQVSWKRLCDLRTLRDPALAFADVRALVAATQRVMGEQIEMQPSLDLLLQHAGQSNSQMTAEDLVFGLSRISANASGASTAPLTPPSATDGGLDRAGSVAFAHKTDKGMAHDTNEDSAMAIEIHISNSDVVGLPLLLAVSDGMGGEDAGEVASRLTLQELLKAVTHLITIEEETEPKAWVQRTVKQINDRMIEQARRLGNQMGATLVFALVQDGVACLGNVGDSRIYRWNAKRNDGQLVRLVKDHSLVQRLVDLGEIRDEDRYAHPERNIVLRSIGDPRNARSDDNEPAPMCAGDWMLLCSDGLWEMVRDDKIREALAGARSPDEACDRLVDMANANGGEDNIAVVVAHFL